MELKDFVKQSLLDIFDAVQEASAEVSKEPRRGAIVPLWGGPEHLSSHEQSIKFDVAVTATSKKRGETGGGIKVFSFADLTAGGSLEAQEKAISRVTFSIPVALPGTTVEGSKPRAPRRKAK